MNPLQIAVAVAFWVCAALVFYTYVGYPLLIGVLAQLTHRPTEPPDEEEGAEAPTISLLIAAYNEEAVIEERIRNALALNYPHGKLEIVVASDGSSDRTSERVRSYASAGVRLLDYLERRGKATVLNSAIPELTGEIVLLSDANTQMDLSAARWLVRWFRDPNVGAVCGRLVLIDPATGTNADGLYWRYETYLKRCEGRIGALLGANGGFYAIRRALVSPLPARTTIDDFVLPLMARLNAGCDIVYEPRALATEDTAEKIRGEFWRRVRFGAGGLQSLGMLWPLLNPRKGWIALSFASHKILRWICPFFLIGMLIGSAALRERVLYRDALIAQATFYLVAVLALTPASLKIPRALRLPGMFLAMNAAFLIGCWRWVRGSQGGMWAPIVRVPARGRTPR